MGDGALVEFGSVADAVQCAAEIQRGMAERNADLPAAQRILLRIGINLGDVIVEVEDIYGDGVNVAARLEALAEPGGICVSDLVRQSVEAKLDLAFDDLGERTLKNIAKPVRVHRLRTTPDVRAGPVDAGPARARRSPRLAALAAGLALLIAAAAAGWLLLLRPALQEREFAQHTALPLPDKPSIAVLPFDNLSGDASQDYFSDGMTENLITDLSRVAGLFVIARNSVFTYKGQPANVREVGRELGVRYVVEGSVQKASDRVRVHAQLIDAATGYHLWADRFDHRLEDVFELQDQVTSDILAALEVKISEAEKQRLARRYTDSVEAYDAFLKGWEQLFVGTLESNRRARRYFERAIQLDPQFARAYANLALTYTSAQSGLVLPDASLEQAHRLAEKAVELDDTLPQVYWPLAFVFTQMREYDQALAALDAAIALDPSYADAHANRAYIMHLRGEPAEAVRLIEYAMRLNPRYPAAYLEELGKAQFALGRYEAATATLENVRERNPNIWTARLFLAASYAETGRIDDAEWEIVELLAADPGLSLAKLGDYVPYEKPADLARLVHALEGAWPRE